MMFFKSVAPHPVLQLSICSLGRDRSIAYGPGSVINGSVFLESSQPIQVQQLSIIFQCQVHQHQRQQQQQPTILFSVTEHIQLNQQHTGIAYDDRTTVISAGSHIHLFAIQLPLVNYPPTIAETTFPNAYHIDYTLQAFLDRPGLPSPLSSDKLSLTYLPLVVATSANKHATTSHVTTMTKCRQDPGASTTTTATGIHLHARMMQSAYCLGEQCKIQLTTDNPTNDKINQIHVTLMTRLDQRHQYINYQQAIPISIPKQTKNHVSYVSIPIAQTCLPTFDYNQLGITVHVDHHIIIGLTPLHHHLPSTTSEPTTVSSSSSRFFSFGSFYNNTGASSTLSPLYLPITVTTIPTCETKASSVPSVIQHDDTTNVTSPSQPYFIPSSASSPIPTGTTNNNDDDFDDDDGQYSVSPSSSFKLDDTDRISIATPPPLDSSSYQHHLTVPSHISTPGSTSSPAHQSLSSGSVVIQLGTTHG